jgi:hypothetical protein
LLAEQIRQKKIKAERKAAKALKKAQKAERKKRREAGADEDVNSPRKSKKDKSLAKMKLLSLGVQNADVLNSRADGFNELKDGGVIGPDRDIADGNEPDLNSRGSFQNGGQGVRESKTYDGGERLSMGWETSAARASQR